MQCYVSLSSLHVPCNVLFWNIESDQPILDELLAINCGYIYTHLYMSDNYVLNFVHHKVHTVSVFSPGFFKALSNRKLLRQ